MRFPVLLALLLPLFIASPAMAQGHVRDRVRAGEVQPLDRIIPQISEGFPGSFSDAQGPIPMPDGELRYRIKWLTPDGHIVWFNADARTGRVLGVEGAPPRFYRYPRGGPFFGPRPPRGWRGGFGGPPRHRR